MGWASGGQHFHAVAGPLLGMDIKSEYKRDILSALISSLQDGDWDCEGEALEEYEEYPEVVEAFRENGVINHCHEYLVTDTEAFTCDAEKNHTGKHKEIEWHSGKVLKEWD